jgi:hypothetical protein
MTNDPGVLLLLLCFAGLLAAPPCIVNLLSIHKWTLCVNYLEQSSFIAIGSTLGWRKKLGAAPKWKSSEVTCADRIRLKNNELLD